MRNMLGRWTVPLNSIHAISKVQLSSSFNTCQHVKQWAGGGGIPFGEKLSWPSFELAGHMVSLALGKPSGPTPSAMIL